MFFYNYIRLGFFLVLTGLLSADAVLATVPLTVADTAPLTVADTGTGCNAADDDADDVFDHLVHVRRGRGSEVALRLFRFVVTSSSSDDGSASKVMSRP